MVKRWKAVPFIMIHYRQTAVGRVAWTVDIIDTNTWQYVCGDVLRLVSFASVNTRSAVFDVLCQRRRATRPMTNALPSQCIHAVCRVECRRVRTTSSATGACQHHRLMIIKRFCTTAWRQRERHVNVLVDHYSSDVCLHGWLTQLAHVCFLPIRRPNRHPN